MKKHAWKIEFETREELDTIQSNERELQAEVKDELDNFFPFHNIKISSVNP